MGYSQFGEEEHIVHYFLGLPAPPAPRRFLDVGAHDGVSCSNTRRLADMGWGGALVEPSPVAFAKLMNVYSGREDVCLANVGVVPPGHGSLMRFYECGSLMVGTFDEKHRDEWEGKQHVHYRPIYVAGVSWQSLLMALPGPYDFVNIDVESTNLALFESFMLPSSSSPYAAPPAHVAKTSFVCVEHDGHVAEMEEIAKESGFVRYHATEANLLFARRP